MIPLRRLILVDSGVLVDPFYAQKTALELPDICKRINNMGTIVSVGKRCRLISNEDVGKQCFLRSEHHEDYRLRPRLSKQLGLKQTWHFIIPEECVNAVIDP